MATRATRTHSDAYVVCLPKGNPKSTGKIPFLQRQQHSNFQSGELPIGLNEAENVEDEERYLEDRNDYSVWATQWPTVQASLHGFIVHELLKHNNTAIHHCTCLSAMVILFPTLIYLKVEFGLAGMPWSVTFVPIWICLLGFLCAPCSRWVFEEKKAHLLFLLIICFIWIPTLIGSILLAYKLDLQ